MRQVNIKELKNTLSKELLDLPVEVTRYGQVVATIYKGSHKTGDVLNMPIKNISKQLTESIEKKQKVATLKATSPTGETSLEYSKNKQIRKKGK